MFGKKNVLSIVSQQKRGSSVARAFEIADEQAQRASESHNTDEGVKAVPVLAQPVPNDAELAALTNYAAALIHLRKCAKELANVSQSKDLEAYACERVSYLHTWETSMMYAARIAGIEVQDNGK